jgi:hypothetical protein
MLWQERYYDSNIRGEPACSDVVCYTHPNSVARGLVERPEERAWSSFRHSQAEPEEQSRSNPDGQLSGGGTACQRE